MTPFGRSERTRFGAGLLCLAVGCRLMAEGRSNLGEREQFAIRGLTAQSQVAAHGLERTNHLNRYWIRFDFVTRAGKTVHRQEEVSRLFYYSHGVHSPLAIQYLDDDPDHARAEPLDLQPWMLFGLAGTLLGFAGFAVGRGGWRLARVVAFERHRVAARATVDYVAELSIFVEERQLCELVYRYVDAFGREHSGRSVPLPRALALAYERRRDVAIVYDARRPQESRLDEPLTEVSAAAGT